MIIEILSPELAEPEALAKALANTTRHYYDKATIFVRPRTSHEWLEYGIEYTFMSGNKLYVAMIQRTCGAEYEFCS